MCETYNKPPKIQGQIQRKKKSDETGHTSSVFMEIPKRLIETVLSKRPLVELIDRFISASS